MASDTACADGVSTIESRWCAEWACGDGMPIVRRMRVKAAEAEGLTPADVAWIMRSMRRQITRMRAE